MKTITLVDICDDDLGEAQCVIDEHGHVIAGWSMNDFNYRWEYANPLMMAFGINVETEDFDALLTSQKRKVRKYFDQ